jgi:anti-sigma B factor antagonist
MSATHPEIPAPFRIDVEPERDVVRVCPHGDVDLATIHEISKQIDELRSRGFGRVVLDLRGATFLDSTGLHLALELTRSSQAQGWEFALIEGPPEVQRAFEVTGVGALVAFVEPARARLARYVAGEPIAVTGVTSRA